MKEDMRELALFTGIGGGILGGVLLGWRTVCAVEIDAYCARRLMQRQNEGHLPPFPIWDDVCTFDGRPWRGAVDVVSGGFPCQDISTANSRGKGIDGSRSGLWREFVRIVREVRPRYVLVENSANLTIRGLGRVLGDLAEMGADGRWGVLSAKDFGACHLRERLWVVANTDREGKLQPQGRQQEKRERARDSRWWATEPGLVRVGHGIPNRVERIRALGNGQVPAVVVGAWETLRVE